MGGAEPRQPMLLRAHLGERERDERLWLLRCLVAQCVGQEVKWKRR